MDAALVVSICAFLGLLGVLAGLGLYLLRSKSHLKEEEEEEEEVQEAVVRRRGAGRGGLRNRRRAGRQALERGTEEDDEEDEEQEEEVPGRSREARRQRRREEKRRAREEQRDADDEAREAREGKANLYEEARRERERLRDEAEAAQEEEIRRAAEERQRQEEEEAEKWRSFISVEDEGQDALEKEEEEKLMERMASWIREQKAVALDDIAVEFKMKTAEVISRIQVLEGGDPPRLTGIMDDRGKYIYISEAELRNVADFIKGRGRISIAELASRSNELLDMSSHQQAAPDLLDLELDNPVAAA